MRIATSRFSRFSRLLVFLPAAVIAFGTPASAETYTENFDDQTYDLSVQLGQGAFWCSQYSNQYGTSGPSLCLFSTGQPTVFTFPSGIQVQGFQFVAGAKNGTTQLTVFYSDGTVEDKPIDGTCCLATVSVYANEGKAITGFSVPADWDLWLFDSLSWFGGSPNPTTTSSVEPSTTVQSTTTVLETTTTSSTSTIPETTTSSTSTTSSTVAAEVLPPPPPDTTTTEVSTTTSSIPETTTTVPVTSTIASTTTVLPTTTTEVASTTTESPHTSVEAPVSVETAPPVGDTVPIDQPPVNASEEEKLEFEAQVDIFSGQYDTYVPVGSKISVAQRRTVVAVTAVMIMFAPPPSRMRRK